MREEGRHELDLEVKFEELEHRANKTNQLLGLQRYMRKEKFM